METFCKFTFTFYYFYLIIMKFCAISIFNNIPIVLIENGPLEFFFEMYSKKVEEKPKEWNLVSIK